MLNVTELNCFVAAAEEVHFGRAAARLNMTQPTLSRQIDALEHTLGVKMFERANRRVTLTTAGRIFLPEAKRILIQIENATNLARRNWRGEAGVLRLGYTATAAFIDLPLILNRAAVVLPDVKILLKESVSAIQKDALLADMSDIGIMRPPIDRDTFGIISLRRERFIAALHSSDPRTSKTQLTLRDFDKKPFVMYSADGAGYSFRILTALFEQAEVNPKFVHHLDQNHTILSLVSSGMGAAMVPDSLALLAFPNVIFKPVKINPPDPLEMFMAWRPQNRNPALAPFLALCRSLYDPSSRK
ncbi:MAG TPA: LysR family transcriptional regulator [Rhizomicrobium sp.]|jgi:DNA-binding transcriptional LysR family regulator